MECLKVTRAGITHPFGDERSVTQAFPAGIPTEEADPFLMCDDFMPTEQSKPSSGRAKHPDDFPVNWHPHRGFDICSYLKLGMGRHADSMGNRDEFATPGMQWMSTGSGIEHAEGGGTPAGEFGGGFQIWINVPAERKLDDPRYGTESPDSIAPFAPANGVSARLLAGQYDDRVGPFKTLQPVQMVDYELQPGAELNHTVPNELDTCMVYVYNGEAEVAGNRVVNKEIALMNATTEARIFAIQNVGSQPLSAMLFAGKKLREPIAWHGPIVMNTKEQVAQTLKEIRSGNFPPKRVPWDYKKAAERPESAYNC